jgi:hypothetical protein
VSPAMMKMRVRLSSVGNRSKGWLFRVVPARYGELVSLPARGRSGFEGS